MNHHIECEAQNTPVTVERIFRIIRVRGFTLHKMELTIRKGKLNIQMVVSGVRPIESLVKLLDKVEDVNRVYQMNGSSSEPNSLELKSA
jgi:acetolactate synthase regulatory subunit